MDFDEHVAFVIAAMSRAGRRAWGLGLRRRVKRRWKILLGLLAVLAVLLAVNTITTGSQTREAEVTVEGGRILEPVARRRPGHRLRRSRRQRPADRADPLLRLLAPLVRRARAAAGREPPGDPHRPDRLRRLREARVGLRDPGPGRGRGGGDEPAWRRGRARRGELDGRIGDRVARGAGQPARRSRRRHRRGPQQRGLRGRAAVPRPALVRPGDRRGAVARHAQLRRAGFVRGGVCAGRRGRRDVRRPRPGGQRLRRDDLHLVRLAPRPRRTTSWRSCRSTSASSARRCRCW